MNVEDLSLALKWRYAVKKFDNNKKIPEDVWSALEQSLVQSPSSFGLQPWKFLIVQNTDLREKLKVATWGQSQVTDCSHYVVLLYRKNMDEKFIDSHLQNIAKTRGINVSSLQMYKENIINNLILGPRAQTVQFWAQRQTYIAMGFLMEAAALLGVDTCPIEGLEPWEYDRILGLKDSPWSTVASVACGYRHVEDKYQYAPKVRFPKTEVLEILK